MDLYEEIREHFEKEYPREGCGVFGVVKVKKQWFPCTNVADDNEDFIIDSKQYLKIFFAFKYDLIVL